MAPLLLFIAHTPSHGFKMGSPPTSQPFTRPATNGGKALLNRQAGLRRTASGRQLVAARQSLLDCLWAAAEDPELTDMRRVQALTEQHTNIACRLNPHSKKVAPGPNYQQPSPHKGSIVLSGRAPVLTLRARKSQHRHSRRKPRRRSDPQAILYHKLKELGRRDFEILKGVRAPEPVVSPEREQLQAEMEVLNSQLADLDLYDELLTPCVCLEDLVETELAIRFEAPKRSSTKQLRSRQAQGMVQLVEDRHDPYPESRILPWDIPVKQKPWWKRKNAVLRRKRCSIDSSTSSGTGLDMSPTSTNSSSSSSTLQARSSRSVLFHVKGRMPRLWLNSYLGTGSK